MEIFVLSLVLCSKEEYINGVTKSSLLWYTCILANLIPYFSEFLSHDLICDNSCKAVETLLVLEFGSLGMVLHETF